MKKAWVTWLGVVFIFALSFNLHAQETATPVQMQDATSVAAISDLDVMLQAVESVPPMPADDATDGSTFYAAQHAPGSAEEWPPLPANIFAMPAWDLGGGIYLLDDRGFVWGRHRKKAALASTALSGAMTAMSPADSEDDESDDDDGGFSPDFVLQTNGLWLQILSVSNGVAYLALNNATDQVYEVMSRTNLISPGWRTEMELWPTNTNSMPFTVPELDRNSRRGITGAAWLNWLARPCMPV
jgi:hypothetical protein